MKASTKPYVLISSLVGGTLFGLGLCVSQMVNPARVIGFLDVTGTWDPTLIFVMLGALIVVIPSYKLIFRRAAPLFGSEFSMPGTKDINSKLILGAVLFGIGWGLAGLCPGPAISAIVTGNTSILIFVFSMFVGFFLHNLFQK